MSSTTPRKADLYTTIQRDSNEHLSWDPPLGGMIFQPCTKKFLEKWGVLGELCILEKNKDTLFAVKNSIGHKACLIPGTVFKAEFRQMLRHEHMDWIGIEVTLARSPKSNNIQCVPAGRRVLH